MKQGIKMDDDIDPISRIALDYGCKSCGAQTDKFYFVHYYILPSRLVRKRHRDKNKCAVYCCSCYEAHEELDIEIDGKPLTVNKSNVPDLNNLRCFICGSEMLHGDLYGVITMFLLMGGSGVESKPLAFLCYECAENYTVEF
jgi:hypothetical protein